MQPEEAEAEAVRRNISVSASSAISKRPLTASRSIVATRAFARSSTFPRRSSSRTHGAKMVRAMKSNFDSEAADRRAKRDAEGERRAARRRQDPSKFAPLPKTGKINLPF